ncbi:MAG: tetratricopeptide repeat protein [Rhodoferax sp.]|uniref:O-linked N-acetylglucosamine transferase family protein n=1 Tax=Rhodoferax sp. TaxID=50421 RepID=UPI00263654D4|nr:tetratricopeptide repeat protein [Rhodoferax sp.]MDD2880961.1 tetratricopeptide repeat protein [Rhodoferax sp.]
MKRTKRQTSHQKKTSPVEFETLARLFGERRFTEAETLALSLTQRFPQNGLNWKVLGAIYQSQGKYAESVASSQRALELLPNDAATLNNLGTALIGTGQLDDALKCIQQALAVATDYAKALNNLGIVYRLQGQLAESEKYCRRAVQHAPTYAQAHMALGNALELQNKLPEALNSYRVALELNPEEIKLHSDVLNLLSLDDQVSASVLQQAHMSFGERFETNFLPHLSTFKNDKDVNRPLHVGFVTNDLYNHALANYLEPLFKGLAGRPALVLHAYYIRAEKDVVTQRAQALFMHWHDVATLSDDKLAEQIRQDGIDILLDLSGHTLPNRLLVFARRVAPVQISWLGYLGSTGLKSMDYYVTDAHWLPPGQFDAQFTEKLLYQPCAAAFEPDALAPPVNALPALSNGHITFGSFNRLNKINPTVVRTWAEILKRVPTSKMVFGGIAGAFQKDLLAQFTQLGVDEFRLSFLKRAVTHEYLAYHHHVDLCLDTFPFGGGATTAHAAWMGVPTLCWTGEKPASRFGAAEMAHLRLAEFIAPNAHDFIELACDWATRIDDLAAVRAGLREQFRRSALCNFNGFADHFETSLRMVWQRWCAGIDADTASIGNDMTNTSAATAPSGEPSALEQQELNNLFNQNRFEAAESLAHTLIVQCPEHGLARKMLGAVLRPMGRYKEALLAHRSAVQYRPNDYEAHFNLACEMQQQGLLDEAVQSYLTALGLQPNNPTAYNNLANIFKTMGLNAQAEMYCRQALELQPDMAMAHNNLGNALHAQGKFLEAVQSYQQALVLKPDWAEALNNLAIVLKDLGESEPAQAAYRAALRIKPDWAAAHSNLLFCLSLDVNTTPQALHEQHLAFGSHFESLPACNRATFTNSKDPHRQLKVGFVSGDFYDHALANFFEPMFSALSALPSLELHAYYTHVYDDAVTKRLQPSFKAWNFVAGYTDADLATKITTDGIDILFDLSGHSAHNRLLTFVRKPAPVQVSYLGYLGTTGLQAMDYYLCDKAWLPPELTWQLAEKAAYLPSAIVFQPSELSPVVNELPALKNGYVTFGSFNRPNKVNASMMMLWSMLLRNVPTSRLMFGGMPQDSQSLLRQSFANEGIAMERLTFFERCNLPSYLALHHQVDFCLDTYPHGGGATTAHAAWMGVPSLCLAGETPASRLGAMEMHHLGLDGFVATSIDDYLEKAQHWASHVTDLAAVRAGMRERFRNSNLMQNAQNATHFELLVRSMWHRWCDDLPPDAIDVDTTVFITPSTQPASTPTPAPPILLTTLVDFFEAKDYPAAHALAKRLTLQYPGEAVAWRVLGYVLQAQENYAASITPLKQALFIAADDPVAQHNLGMALVALNQADQALPHLQEAVRLDPGYVKALVNLAMVQQFKGDVDAAQANCEAALRLDEQDASAYIQLGKVFEEKGQISEAQACYYRADMAHEPRREVAHSNVLYLLNHDVLVEPQHLFEEHLAFGQRFQTPLLAQQHPHSNNKDPDRVLHIGFVSGDLNHHALANFLEPLFEQLAKKSRLTLHAFYTKGNDDEYTQRMRQQFHTWHSVVDLDDAQLAELVRAEKIDILIDLAGHTAKNRLLAFARKPAPIQASWLGYLGTTGLKAMDYYISDAYWIPPGDLDWQFAEKMAYLPSVVTFKPHASSPPVNALPALKHGAITFGSFNRANKINASVIALWSMLLRSIPSSCLFLCAIENEDKDDLIKSFAAESITSDRLGFCPRVATADYLALHHQVDICLDTFPHAGGATTANAAWMGVPTLGMAGQTPASRFSAALMHQLGLDDFVAGSIEEFVHIGRYWSDHLDALAQLRSGMRQRFASSMLGQPKEFANAFETMLRTMWQGWCIDAAVQSLNINNNHTFPRNSKARFEPILSELPSLVVVSASKLSEYAFWAQSALGLSIKRLVQQGENISVDIAFQNARGLPEIFNAAIERAHPEDILVFMHDDVWIDEYNFSQTVAAGLKKFDVIGVAGNKRRLPNQPAWCFVDQNFTWDDKNNLSGHVGHGVNAFGQLSNFGEVPSACELLDGVFIAARKSTLITSKVQFDPQFAFHFYDVDFCRTARESGLTLGTWSVHLTHQSGGAFGGEIWSSNFFEYKKKWNDFLTLVNNNLDQKNVLNVCIGHKAPPSYFNDTFDIFISPIEIKEVPNALVIPDEIYGINGNSLSEYSQLIWLSKNIDYFCKNLKYIRVFHYRRFTASNIRNSRKSTNAPWINLVKSSDVSLYKEDFLNLVSNELYNTPVYFKDGMLEQYASNHFLEDILNFTKYLVSNEIISKNDACKFLNIKNFIPSCSIGVFKKIEFTNLMGLLEQAALFRYSDSYIDRSGYQRRTIGFLLERFHSFLILIMKERNILTGNFSNHMMISDTNSEIVTPSN